MKRAIAVSALVLAVTSACGGSGDKEANERIIRSLPEFPGTQVLRIESRPYEDCSDLIFHRKIGEITTIFYEPPAHATAEQVVQYYVEQVSADWQRRREDIGVGSDAGDLGKIPVARFQQGTATVYVHTESMATRELKLGGEQTVQSVPNEFIVSIDAEGTVERPYCD